MIFSHESYRTFLRAVLTEKIQKNRSYSLRAMARDLDLLPSHLSSIMQGQKNLSLASALKVSSKLGLEQIQSEYFCALVQFESAKDADTKNMHLEKLRALNASLEKVPVDLSVEVFKAISDWYHIPILEMTALDDVQITPEFISEKLGISKLEAKDAIDRLIRIDLLQRDNKGRLKKAYSNYMFKTKGTAPALRRFHRAMLLKAIESLETQDSKQKYIGSQTFSIDPSQLPKAFKMIDEFSQNLVSFFNKGKKATRTYHLDVVLFDLFTKENRK